MQLKEFLSDSIPTGKGAVKIPAKEIIDKYKDRYDKMVKRKLKFSSNYYKIMNEGVVVHVKVPSETVDDFYYDVLLQFISNGANSFEECDIRIFSNSPSFVYSYAYVFYHLKDPTSTTKSSMIIDEFHKKIPKDRLLFHSSEKKLDKEILTQRPVVRNPYGLPLFDKTIYHAIFYVQDNLNYGKVINNTKLILKSTLLRGIKDYDSLMKLRDSQMQKNSTKKSEDKSKLDKKIASNERKMNKINRGETSSSVNKVNQKSSSSITRNKKVSSISSINKKKK